MTNSNTTFVKVKSLYGHVMMDVFLYSNTTFVKVKSNMAGINLNDIRIFKYNIC